MNTIILCCFLNKFNFSANFNFFRFFPMPILGSSGGIEMNGHKSGWITLSMLLNAYAGLQINTKTKSMTTGKNTSQRPCTNHALWTSLLETIDLPIEQVNNFVYLGSTISSDGTIA